MKKLLSIGFFLCLVCELNAQFTFPKLSSVSLYVTDSIKKRPDKINALTLNKAFQGVIQFIPDIVQDTASVLIPQHGWTRFQRKDSSGYVYDTIGYRRWRKLVPTGAGVAAGNGLQGTSTHEMGGTLTGNVTYLAAPYGFNFGQSSGRINLFRVYAANEMTFDVSNILTIQSGNLNYITAPSMILEATSQFKIQGTALATPVSDTGAYKPFVINSSGDIKRFTHWPGGSSGGSGNLQGVTDAGSVTTNGMTAATIAVKGTTYKTTIQPSTFLSSNSTLTLPTGSGIAVIAMNLVPANSSGNIVISTSEIPEGGTNWYHTPARVRTSISLTTTGTSGAASYSSSTGVLNIPTPTDKADKTGSSDIEITDYTKGIILKTSDGTRARITLVKVGGVLTLQISDPL